MVIAFIYLKTSIELVAQKCNGNLKNTDLIEEIIKLTLKNKGEVEIVEDLAAQKLKEHEGIGARLRY